MSDLDRLFYWRGIAPDFYNFRGELTPVPIENRLKLLQAMGVNTDDPGAVAQEAFELDIKPWQSWLPPLELISAIGGYADINFPPEELGENFRWRLNTESGELINQGVFVPAELEEVGDYVHEGRRYTRRRLQLGHLDANYYDFELCGERRSQTTKLAAAPEQAWLPDWAGDQQAKPWGLLIQLYTLKSNHNWGIGDFSDLQRLIIESSNWGVDVIGLNPFHALQSNLKHDYSPYNPSDRRFLNALYIDVEQACGFDTKFVNEDAINNERQRSHVNFEAQRQLKYQALWYCFNNYLSAGKREVFVRYIEQSDNTLLDFANYQVQNNWAPESIQRNSGNKKDLLKSLQMLLLSQSEHQLLAFYCYLQWQSDEQFELCQKAADAAGMSLGLVRDLAVGANGGGCEVQSNGKLFCHDASVGAPPDPLALTGQNWGLPPMDPAELRRTGFAHYIKLLRSNMTHCGALRIDHAMSLYRLWWCPPGATADKGAYIYYPFKELLGLLCLESHLHKCAIIAEDLGIVPEEFKLEMQRTGLYSNKVFYFEKVAEDRFKHPRDYAHHALAMLNNHDVPTIVSWWNASDLELRDSLDLLGNNNTLENAQALRERERCHLLSLMQADNMLPVSWSVNDSGKAADVDLVHAILRFVSQASSQFFMVQLEDLMMMDAPVNVPGTYLEHENWSRRLQFSLEELFADDILHSLFDSITTLRKSI
ncbi:4-alpha-glucanotransferase [Agaribacterium haliotis]|uniref:4-alpha-glucanotransferase n=1 Tax=Agaribacterium haliotis TaxID=2013869 RepID=UPI000BB59DF8|nr:4-alpha-glucanotransferase [Agaribacterium haliotis]